MCKRAGGDARGSAAARRARKTWMLSTPLFGGNGHHVNCVHCGDPLSYSTVEADRIIPGNHGGAYRRENIIPSCRLCNSRRKDRGLWSFNPNLARRLRRRGIPVAVTS